MARGVKMSYRGPQPTLDEFTRAYIEAALWSSIDENTGRPMDESYGERDVTIETLRKMIADCKAFQGAHWDDISSDPKRAGHDFWLTRNGHGSGFWDGDWPEPAASRLTSASKGYGEFNLYVGDDDFVHGYPL